MKAIRVHEFGGPEVLRLEDVPEPRPGAGQVLVRVRAAGEINPRLAMARDAAVLGMMVFNATPQELASVHAAIVAGLEAGTLRPVVGRELPLSDAARAHEEVLKPGAYGKIVLIPLAAA